MWPPMLRPACDTAAMQELIERLSTAAAGMEALRGSVVAGEPWPLSRAYGAEPESDWGPKEILAHVAEMLAYWPVQVERDPGVARDWGAARVRARVDGREAHRARRRGPPASGRRAVRPDRLGIPGGGVDAGRDLAGGPGSDRRPRSAGRDGDPGDLRALRREPSRGARRRSCARSSRPPDRAPAGLLSRGNSYYCPIGTSTDGSFPRRPLRRYCRRPETSALARRGAIC